MAALLSLDISAKLISSNLVNVIPLLNRVVGVLLLSTTNLSYRSCSCLRTVYTVISLLILAIDTSLVSNDPATI